MGCEMFRECLEIIKSGGAIELALKCIRDRGGSKIDCIIALIEGNRYTNRQAKIIVDYSQTWRDCRQDDDAFHEGLVESLREIGLQTKELTDKDKSEALEALRVLGIDFEKREPPTT